MPNDLVAVITRWTRDTNRRVGLEESVRALAWLAIAAVIAAAALLLPGLVDGAGFVWSEALPTEQTMATVAYVIGGVAPLVILGVAVVRYRRRRIDSLSMARRIDEQQGTKDLVATALAVQSGTVSGSPELQQVVMGRAVSAVGEVRRPLPSFSVPAALLTSAGLMAALSMAFPWLLDEVAALTISPAEAAENDDDTVAGDEEVEPLDEETKERIDNAIEQLQRYERNPALRREARDQLAQAREHLQRALDDPKQAASSLSRAEQALRQLAKEARRQGLFDKEQLSEMSEEQLTKSMSEAMENNQHDTAAELGKELAERMEKGSSPELKSMAEAFRKHFPPTSTPSPGPKPEGSRETGKERRERWRKQLEDMAKDMENGESGMSSSEMRRLAEELGREAERGNGSMGRDLDETLGEVRGARRRHLDELGKKREGKGKPGEGKGPGKGGKSGKGPGKGGKPGKGRGPGKGEGKGPGEGKGKGGEGKAGEGKGKPGEGDSSDGPPSGKPGPGGGAGSRRYGFLPPGSVGPASRVDVPSGGPPEGAVRIIERAATGPGRTTKEYEDIHHEYSAVAEAAVRREEIPLTRRDYIRDYFQAVRPK